MGLGGGGTICAEEYLSIPGHYKGRVGLSSGAQVYLFCDQKMTMVLRASSEGYLLLLQKTGDG